jgi:hypothetical protein
MATKSWNVQAASSESELQDVLLTAAAGIKTQVLQSKLLKQPKYKKLKERLSVIADELHGMQQDVVITS